MNNLGDMLERVKKEHPLIHNITNYVTVNDCANIILACGASPIMADDPGEVEEITSLCRGLNINIGTLNARTIESMMRAGHKAAELGHPLLLDPVGAGASALRTTTAEKLMAEIPFSVIRGNASEIRTLAEGTRTTQGVDVNILDAISEKNLSEYICFAREFAKQYQVIVSISGVYDIVSDGEETVVIANGCAKMSEITGSGCMLSALTTSYIAANPDDKFSAVVAATCVMGLAGEHAMNRMRELDGNASFRTYLIDAVNHMTKEDLLEGASYESR